MAGRQPKRAYLGPETTLASASLLCLTPRYRLTTKVVSSGSLGALDSESPRAVGTLATVTAKTCIFIGYDRARDPQQRLERTRKHLAILLDTPYPEYSEQYAWTNLYGEDAADEKGNPREDARRARLLIDHRLGNHERAVLLGNDVAAAFECDHMDRYRWQELPALPGLQVARMPYTSLRNWNQGGRWGRGHGPWVAEAHEFLQDLRGVRGWRSRWREIGVDRSDLAAIRTPALPPAELQDPSTSVQLWLHALVQTCG